jgi:glycosyltransferase involved in cell wall biosynthesis
MNVAVITQWFDPEGGSAAIPGSMVRALEARGHRVQVITGVPNYPTGTVYDGYRVRLHQVERQGVTKIHRVALYPSHDRSPIRRSLNFLSFMVSASTLGVFLARRSRVALVYSTPATVGLAGVVLRSLFGKHFVLYVQDLWPDTLVASGMLPARLTRPVIFVLNLFCHLVYRRASRIAVISPGMKRLLSERGVPEHKIDVIYNWVDEEVFQPVHVVREPSTFDVMYAGNLGDLQGLDVLVRAMAEVQDLPDLRMILVGDGVAKERLVKLSRDLGVSDRVIFAGTRDVKEMSQVMAAADVQVVSLLDLPIFHATMPSKVQAILACGRPMIVAAPGDAADLVRTAGAGIVAKPGDVPSMTNAIRTAYGLRGARLEAMGAQGHEFYRRELSSHVGASRLEAALEAAAGGL